MAEVIAEQSSIFQRAGQNLLSSAGLITRVAAVGVLTAIAPGAALLLAPVWQRLRGDKDYYAKGEAPPPTLVAHYEITPQHKQYGSMRDQLDGLLAKANQPTAPLLVLPAMYDGYRTGTFTRSRTLILKEEFLDFLSLRERAVVVQHEAAHLIKPENRLKNIAEEFALDAKQICGKFGLKSSFGFGMGMVATAITAPDLFQHVANSITQVSPVASVLTKIPALSSGITLPFVMLMNAVGNYIIGVPLALIANRYATRRAEFASDRFVVDQHGNADMLTHTLLRYESYPDPGKQASIPMKTVLEKPKLGWQEIKDRLRWDNLMADHPSTYERIRAATAYAESKGAKPFLGMTDTWRANVEPPRRPPLQQRAVTQPAAPR